MEMFQVCGRQNNVCPRFLSHYFLLFVVTAHVCLEMYDMPHGGQNASDLCCHEIGNASG